LLAGGGIDVLADGEEARRWDSVVGVGKVGECVGLGGGYG
jgi:hypothetical protein